MPEKNKNYNTDNNNDDRGDQKKTKTVNGAEQRTSTNTLVLPKPLGSMDNQNGKRQEETLPESQPSTNIEIAMSTW